MSYDEMMIALRESQSVPTKLEAGIILAQGGWAIFPAPNNAKFDVGLSYLSATTDPARFNDMAQDVMLRNECHDVNICLAPGKCTVPLIVVDLDGTQAIQSFFDDAVGHGHLDVQMWLRVNTTRVDHGRHIYFVSPDGEQWSNSSHVWGGEVRSGRGHVVMPPSTTETGRYTWAGEKLYAAPQWVIDGLKGGRVKNAERTGYKTDDEIETILYNLSQWGCTSYGRTALNNLLAEMRDSMPGAGIDGRNPRLSRSINRMLDLAVSRDLNAYEALGEIADQYQALFSPDETHRSPLGEVRRCVESWMNNHDTAELDADNANVVMAWANARGGGR